MSDANRVVLSGRVTRDTELKFTTGGTAVAEFGLCSNDVRKDKEGNKIETPMFVDVTLWGKAAEGLQPHLTKGTYVVVDGRLKLDTWENDGQKRSKHGVTADKVTLVPGGRPRQQEQVPVGAASANGDDEIPF